jgi:enoyl-CoA hydratase/carnithine racemase
MTAEPGLLLAVDGAVATVTISNPAKRNAMTAGMWAALPPLLERLAADPAVRVLVLTGAEGTFCAGVDIADLRGPAVPAVDPVPAEDALSGFPKPTLAVVRGACVGGGCQLAVACDLRFAAEGARFGVTPARLGIVYPPSSTRRLAALVGPATAKHLLFSAELIDAPRALRTGLVDELLPDAELDARVAAYAGALAARSALTQAAAKDVLNGAGADRAAHWQREALESEEAREGVEAFLERREPAFRWRAGAGSPGPTTRR